jgi:hypothetical protein
MGPRLRATPLITFGLVFGALALVTRCGSSDSAAPEQDAGVSSTNSCETDGTCSSLPASTCNAGGTALLYYTDPKCVLGRCQWQQQTMACPCADGGCRFSSTTGSATISEPADGAVDGAIEGAERDASAHHIIDGSDDAALDHVTVGLPDGGSCSGDDAGTCQLPPSLCADDRWLAYFTNATCVDGRCRWDVGYRDCDALSCVGGGCQLNVTR